MSTWRTKGVGLSSREYIPELDGLRAAGLALVLVNHLWPKEIAPLVWGAGKLAWIAMDLFFALSGFLIAGILLDSRDRPDYYRAYYVRRTLRIFPLYYIVLIYLTGRALFWHDGVFQAPISVEWGSPLWFFAYLGNVAVALAGAFPPLPGLIPLWSLQIEEQFYLLFPLAVRSLPPRRLAHVLWALVILAPVLRCAIYVLWPESALPPFVLLPCHMEGLALGALIALGLREGSAGIRRAASPALAAVLLGATCVASRWSNTAGLNEEYATPFNRTIGITLSSVACATLVLCVVRYRGSPALRVLRAAPVRYVGKISYGIYLLHLPVRELIFALHHRLGWTLPRDSVPMFLIVVAASVGAASISWLLLERPLLRLKSRLAPSAASARRAA